MGNDKTDENKGLNAGINLPLNPTPENENYEDHLPSIEGDCEGYLPPPKNESVQQNIGALLLEKRLHDKRQESEKELKPEDFLRQGYEQIQKARKQILYACTFIFCGVLLLLFYVTLAKGKIDKYTGDIDKLKKSMESLDKTIQDKIDISVKNIANKETPATTGIAKFQAKSDSMINASDLGITTESIVVNGKSYNLVADSRAQFSDTQGKYGWQYGYYRNSISKTPFSPLIYIDLGHNDARDHFGWVHRLTGLTVGQNYNRMQMIPYRDDKMVLYPARLWTNTLSDGYLHIKIEGALAEHSDDGIVLGLYLDDQIIWSSPQLTVKTQSEVQHTIDSLLIRKGQTLKMVVDPLGNSKKDYVDFLAKIYLCHIK